MNELGSGWIQGTGGFVCQEYHGFLGKLPCQYHSLFFPTTEVTGNMGDPVGHLGQIKKINGHIGTFFLIVSLD
ncbi:hypothetical protein DSECCO2_662790 [anaerobic digester metagenome]